MAEKPLVACNDGEEHGQLSGPIPPDLLNLQDILVPGPGIDIVILSNGDIQIVNTCEGVFAPAP